MSLQVRRARLPIPKWAEDKTLKSRTGPSDRRSRESLNIEESSADSGISQALEVVKQRSVPSMLIVGLDNKLLYVSKDAIALFKDTHDIPAEIRQLCDRVRNNARLSESPASSEMNCAIFKGPGDILYSLRGFPAVDQNDSASHIMVLIEKVGDRGPINFQKARTRYGLSAREIEVVVLLAKGCCNKEIGAKLYISEHTVKGHLKNITRKIGAESRGNIVAMLK